MYRNVTNAKAVVRSVERRKSGLPSILIAIYNSTGINLGNYVVVSVIGNKCYLESKKNKVKGAFKVQKVGTLRQLADISTFPETLIDFIGEYPTVHLDSVSGQAYLKLDEKEPLMRYETQARAPFKKSPKKIVNPQTQTVVPVNTPDKKKEKPASAAKTPTEVVVKEVEIEKKTVPVFVSVDEKREQSIKLLVEAVLADDLARAKVIAEMYNLMFD